MRGRTLVQFLSAVELLARPVGATIKDLEQHLSVDRRSVYRMLDTIQQLGFPLYDEQDPSIRRKRWRFEDGYLRKLPNIALPEFRLTPSELVALFLLRCGSGLFKDTGIDRHIESAFNKFTSLLPKKGMMGRIEGLQALFISSAKLTKDLSKSGPVIEELTFAMIRGVTCRVLYHSYSDDIEKRFMMNPLHFFERSGGLYLLTSRSERKGVRTLAVERIKEVELGILSILVDEKTERPFGQAAAPSTSCPFTNFLPASTRGTRWKPVSFRQLLSASLQSLNTIANVA